MVCHIWPFICVYGCLNSHLEAISTLLYPCAARPSISATLCDFPDTKTNQIQSDIDKLFIQLGQHVRGVIISCMRFAMPPKQVEELTTIEIYLLGTATRLQAAVKWVEHNSPPPNKWPYLNAKVKDEIVSVDIIPLKVQTDIVF